MYQVDAFTSKPFKGNPAAVCIMHSEFPDRLLQDIAAENNLAETAFICKNNTGYKIRWFTPAVEVDLCGHATLASAYILYYHLNENVETLKFDSRSGPLFVSKEKDGKLILDFPADSLEQVSIPDGLENALGVKIIDCIKGKSDYLVRIETEKSLEDLKPNLFEIAKLKSRGLIVTAKGNEVDFVSRCFFPQSGIDEDPVTGSAHTTLTPYWANKTGKTDLKAKQISSRGGELYLTLRGDRVLIGGYAVLYLEGTIFIDL